MLNEKKHFELYSILFMFGKYYLHGLESNIILFLLLGI